MTEVIVPFVESLDEFNHLVTESKMWSTNWVYLHFNEDDKKSLDSLHQFRYPVLKKKLNKLVRDLEKKEDEKKLQAVFVKVDSLIKYEKKIMSNLKEFNDYENPTTKFTCEALIEDEVLPRSQEIFNSLKSIVNKNRKDAEAMKQDIEHASSNMMKIMLGVSVGLFLFVLIAIAFISRAISKPVIKMKSIVAQLAKGELPEEKVDETNNVIGKMGIAVNTLSESFTRTSHFANEIGKGNLNAHYDKLSDNDLLGNALINMRNSLHAYSVDMENKVKVRTAEVIEKGIKLEQAYKEIKDSITYAKRIQESILPADEIIFNVFENSFVFYKPKDIVCGDFYWFSHRGDEVIFAAVDCTGHGVPGALMTVIGNSLLNQIVNFSGVTDPSKILTQLDKKLLETFQQHGAISTNDGMDAAVCRYKLSKKEITFSGAKRPLFLFKNHELIEIKGNKSPIGSYLHEYDKLFTDHKMTVNSNDTIYIFSDGFQDQFGGHDGKKFMVGRFRDLLKEIQPLTMKEQANRLEKEIQNWQGRFEQTDDMLLMGVRF